MQSEINPHFHAMYKVKQKTHANDTRLIGIWTAALKYGVSTCMPYRVSVNQMTQCRHCQIPMAWLL